MPQGVREARPKRNARSKPAPIPRQTRSAAHTTATDSNMDMDIDQNSQEKQPTPQPRLRIRYTVNPEPSQSTATVITPIKRKPGRPRKHPESVNNTINTPTSTKRKKKADDGGVTKRRKKTKDDADTKRRKKLEVSGKQVNGDATLRSKQTDENNVEVQQMITTQPMEADEAEGGNNNDEEDGKLDEKGEQKITKDGELLGGRKFKVQVFQLPSRGNTWYMLSMDPAKLLGFRDSYLFFLRNPTLKRIHATDQERDYLITHGFLPSNFRSRAITLVSARATYKLFGSKIIVGGKRRKDDYYESSIRFNDDDLSDKGEASGADNASNILSRRVYLGSKPRKVVNKTNWMYQTALSTRDYNTRLKIHRKEKPRFYDPHTNIDQVPQATQPTCIRVEALSQPRVLPLSSDITIATKDPDIHFETVPHNPFGTLDPEVLEVLPHEIRQIVDSMQKEEEARQSHEEKYPIALMDGQFQHRYPIHRTRFGQDLPRVLKHPSAVVSHQETVPRPSTVMSHDANETPYEQRYYYTPDPTSNIMNKFQYTTGKAPPQYICGVLTATTGQPCKRGVSFEGDRCMYHKGHPRDPINVEATSDRNTLERTKPVVIGSGLVQLPNDVTTQNYSVVAPTPNAAQPLPVLPENSCAICFSVTAPDAAVPRTGAPCSKEYKSKCANCQRKYHPLCIGLTTPRPIIAMEGYSWLCNDCKSCVVCHSSEDESTLLICDDCDRGWHLDCSDPKVTEVPQGPWLCSLCAQCNSCGEKAISLNDAANNYHHAEATSESTKYPIYLATICNKCNFNFSEDRFCPMCLKTYSEDGEENEDDKEMICCDVCDRWIHIRCDEDITSEKYQELVENTDANYKCPLCDERIMPMDQGNEKQKAALTTGQPSAVPVAIIAGGRRIRGIAEFKEKKVAVPEIQGWNSQIYIVKTHEFKRK
ncbi:chromatin remodelling complex Rsc7/Swp82 subunit-domain-containing protein [Rhizophagus clarus]|uniref:Chromatin remodelling complex Rsc7/Swp82 subunit-domain-containing protein n=1 Tax=Rhizophagus clarus TaxID=94130 RepID=A0A8H3LG77_9GLOM|nr:chromatin remodelling complex Rsc7/Swp82 subunit-domain-containing protein [Rhizophagus clarus]